MLRKLKDIEKYTVSATDGDIGSVANFLFDDEQWTIRYLVAETDGTFAAQRVLISPVSLRQVDWASRRLHVALTSDKVRMSPSIDVDKPVSRQHEREYYRYYGYPYYWGYSGRWRMGASPELLLTGRWKDDPRVGTEKVDDVHLRSVDEVRGYHIEGRDGPIGHVEDFIVDDETWQVRYLVIDTSNWWFGKKVLVAPHWANRISWEERKVHVDLFRHAVKGSPEWHASAAVVRDYEARLYDYYGRPAYWSSGDPAVGRPQVEPSAKHPG
ncbi:MAG TPA: PRC-barrel domain-containing protein [Polyangiaceae bacterium]|nr:PRC-barrel domain-containing protein [Polyangiaceae bacterium]